MTSDRYTTPALRLAPTLLLLPLATVSACGACHENGDDSPRAVTCRVPVDLAPEDLRTETDETFTEEVTELAEKPILKDLIHRYYGELRDELTINRASATKLEIGPEQIPRLFAMVEGVSQALGLETPRTYLVQADRPNAYVIGVDRPILVIHSALLNLLTPEELLFVLGHELGHVKARHSLPSQIVAGGLAVTERVPTEWARQLFSTTALTACLRWSRAAEITADRAGLLVVGDADVAARALVRLISGVEGGTAELNVNRFVQQRLEYEEGTDMIERFPILIQEARRDHPFAATRILALRAYSESDKFRALFEDREVRIVEIPLL